MALIPTSLLKEGAKVVAKATGSAQGRISRGTPSAPKVLIKNAGDPISTPKSVVIKGSPGGDVLTTDKLVPTADSDIAVGDILEKVRENKGSGPTAGSLQDNFKLLPAADQAKVQDAISKLQPGENIDTLIQRGKDRRKTAVLTAVGVPGVGTASTQVDDEAAVLAQFNQFTSEQDGTPLDVPAVEPLSVGASAIADGLLDGNSVSRMQSLLLANGFTEDEVSADLIPAGVDMKAAMLEEGSTLSEVIDSLNKAGFEQEQINEITLSGDSVPLLPDEDGELIVSKRESIVPKSSEAKYVALEIAAKEGTLRPEDADIAAIAAQTSQIQTTMTDTYNTIKSYFGDEEAKWNAQLANIKLMNSTSAALNKFGLKSEVVIDDSSDQPTAKIFIQDKDGNPQEMTITLFDSLVQDVLANRMNIAGTLALGAAGARVGNQASAALSAIPYVGWATRAVITLASGAIAAGYAAYEGTGADIVRNSIAVNMQINDRLMKEQMVSAGLVEGAMGIGIGTAGVIVSGSFKVGSSIVRMLKSGNEEAAFNALKSRVGNVSNDEIRDMLTEAKEIIGLKLNPRDSLAKQALEVLPKLDPRLTSAMSVASKSKPISSVDLTNDITRRAASVIEATNKASSKNIGKIVSDELAKYEGVVKDNYRAVKRHAVQEIDGSGTYTFDYNKLAIQPFLDKMEKQIVNGRSAEDFKRQLEYMQTLGAYEVRSSKTKVAGSVQPNVARREIDAELLGPDVGVPAKTDGSGGIQVDAAQVTGGEGASFATVTTPVSVEANSLRSFNNLMELRIELNKMKGGNTSNIAASNGIDAVLKSIDGEIATMSKSMDGGEDWLKLWNASNTEYSKFLQVKENDLFKALTKSSETNDQKVASLARHIGDTDDTFMEVVEKLPVSTRRGIENAVLSKFISDSSIGSAGDFQAIHFPILAEKLGKVSFSTPEAQTMSSTIKQMAKVYRADPQLGVATDNITVEAFQSVFTADPVVRAKMTLARSVMNYVRRYFPGENGRASALVTNLASVMSKPLDVNTTKQLVLRMQKDPSVVETLEQLRISQAQFGDSSKPVVQVYSDSPSSMNITEGVLGKGAYFKGSEDFFKGSTQKRLDSLTIRPERVAKEKEIRSLVKPPEGSTIEDILADPNTSQQLKELGYIGVAIGEDVMLF